MISYSYYSYGARKSTRENRLITRIAGLIAAVLPLTKYYLCGMILCFCMMMLLSLTPSLFMDHSLEQGGIRLLSDRALSENTAEIIGKIHEAVAASELYRPDMKFKIYLCNNHWLYLLASNLNMHTMGTYQLSTGRILINMQSILSKNSLEQCIAHEITHAMVRDHLGWRTITLPKWVSEGYAEYVAYRYWTKRDAMRELGKIKAGETNSDKYAHYRLLVTYALDEWKVPLDTLFSKPPKTKDLIFAMQSQSIDRLILNIVRNDNNNYLKIRSYNRLISNISPIT